jgi:hypothetical protein
MDGALGTRLHIGHLLTRHGDDNDYLTTPRVSIMKHRHAMSVHNAGRQMKKDVRNIKKCDVFVSGRTQIYR